MQEKRYLTTKEVLDRLQLADENTIYSYIKQGLLNGFRLGKEWRFTEADLHGLEQALRSRADEERQKERQAKLDQALQESLVKVPDDVSRLSSWFKRDEFSQNLLYTACRDLRWKLAAEPATDWIIGGCSGCSNPVVVPRTANQPQCGLCNGRVVFKGRVQVWYDPRGLEPVSPVLISFRREHC